MQPPGKLSGAREISDQEKIPASFLPKVLLQLRRGRLLRSYKGIGGGYELALPPGRISLLAIVHCIEGDLTFTRCVLEDHECSTQGECLLHQPWCAMREQLRGFLERNTLAVLARQRHDGRGGPAGADGVVGITGPLEQ
jgi:Rrf2 family protein